MASAQYCSCQFGMQNQQGMDKNKIGLQCEEFNRITFTCTKLSNVMHALAATTYDISLVRRKMRMKIVY